MPHESGSETMDRENRAVSEVVGTIILIAVVMVGVAFVAILLFSNPPPTKVPSFNAIISNQSNTVYIYHKGGDALQAGEFQIYVDGVDRTVNFTLMSPGSFPFSVGETLTSGSNLTAMPRHVVILFTGLGSGGTVIMESDVNPILQIPTHRAFAPIIDWFNSPIFGNTTTPFTFTDNSTTSENPITYLWMFNATSNATTKNATHTFPCTVPYASDYCLYSINHSATDSKGTSYEVTSWLNRSLWVTVFKNSTPSVTITSNVTTGMIPLAVHFTGTQIGSIRVDTWHWDFGDMGTADVQNPDYAYFFTGRYNVTLTATNYTLGVTTVTNYLVNATPNPPWYCNFSYRKKITIDHTKVLGSFTYLPVLIDYDDSDLTGSKVQNDGDDIVFTTASGWTRMPYQIENFTKSSGSLTAWVNVSSVNSTANNSIYLYYGNSTITGQQNATTAVWTGYGGVWHLNETTGTDPKDSTSNGYTGSQYNSPVQMGGKVDGSLNFSGGSKNVSMADIFDYGTGAFTASAWVKGGGGDQNILGKSVWAGTNGIQLYTAPDRTYLTAPQGTFGITSTGNTNYPTLTAGTTSQTNLNSTNMSLGKVSWYRQTGTIKGTVISMRIYVQTTGGNIRVALFADQGLGQNPGAKILESASVAAGSSTSWQTIDVPDTYVDNTSWWIGLQYSSGSFRYRTNYNYGAQNWYANKTQAYGGFPADGTGATRDAYQKQSVIAAYVQFVQLMGFAKATKASLLNNNTYVENVSFYSHAAGQYRLAIYDDSSGVPNSRLWESGSNTATASSWNSVPVSLTLNQGTYWMAWQWNSLNNGSSYASGSAGDGNYIAQAYGSFPDTWSGGTSTSERWSVNASYGIKIGANDGNWHYLTVTRTGTGANGLTTYYDGELVGNATDTRTLSNSNRFRLARPNENSNYFTGSIDEVRVDNEAKAASWIGSLYNNQASPTTFHYSMPEENWNWSWACSG
jgi:flagellin-like protein